MKKIILSLAMFAGLVAPAFAGDVAYLPFKEGFFGVRSPANAAYLTCLGETVQNRIFGGYAKRIDAKLVDEMKDECVKEIILTHDPILTVTP